MTEQVRAVRASAYTIPTEVPEADGTIAWDSTTLVLVEAEAGGCTGIGWSYGAAAGVDVVQSKLADLVRDSDVDAVPGTNEAMRRALRNMGLPGIGATAVSAVDLALWDLKARVHDVPLHRLLGTCRDRVPVYGSGGFTTFDDERLTAQLRGWVDAGIPRVKIKVGESWGTNVARDVARTRLARSVIGADVELFVDANGGYTRKQAVRFWRTVSDADVTWFEEPVSSEDVEGLRVVCDAVDADVAAGEYAYGLGDLHRLAPVVDVLQADITRCGGVTGWLRAAAVAAGGQLQISSHCAPHAHLAVAAAVPNLRHIEWFSDHVRIESMLFDGAEDPVDGELPLPERPGHGMTWKAADAEKYRVA